MRDLKKSKNMDYRTAGKGNRICECLTTSPSQVRHQRNSELEMELLKEPIPANLGENAFLGKMLKDQIMPRIQTAQAKPAMMAEFEERFKRILKRIYRSLQQNEIRQEILDERRRIASQWENLASVLDRFLLLIFVFSTIIIIMAFMLPSTHDDID